MDSTSLEKEIGNNASSAADSTNIGTATEDMTNGVVVIPLEKFAISDAQIEKSIFEKIEDKMVKVKNIAIHRNPVDGAFLRSDVLIEPTAVARIKETDFAFSTCVVHSCPIVSNDNG